MTGLRVTKWGIEWRESVTDVQTGETPVQRRDPRFIHPERNSGQGSAATTGKRVEADYRKLIILLDRVRGER